MKTIEEIKKDCIGDVFATENFIKAVNNGWFNSCDGIGFFHDGEEETDIEVFSRFIEEDDIKKYPYVCWYNK